ncbi:MAG: hypothetical protein HP490_04070 [Nitrospira sp.]|nr:hypothetical protein [Nitrospira sp.]
MSHKDHDNAESARAGARQIIEHAPKVLAGLAGVGGLAYLAGAIYTRSYFSEFGASWILDEVPMATYFGQSWIPLLLILFFVYLATTNLAVLEHRGNLTESTRFKISVAIVHYGPWLVIVLLASTSLLSTFGYAAAVIVLAVVSIVLLLLLFGSALELVAVRLSRADRRINLSMVYVSFAVIATGLYVVPVQLGVNWARVDKQVTSVLLRVYLRDDEVTEYKLLFTVGERLYVFPTRYEGDYPPVRTAAVADIRFVQPVITP